MVITSAFGKVEWVNKAFEKMTGYKLSEAKGKSPGSLLQGENSDSKTVNFMRMQVQKLEPFTCEIINYKKIEQ